MAEQNKLEKPHSMAGTAGYPISEEEKARIDFYHKLSDDNNNRKRVQNLIIPAKTGKGFIVERGQILRVTCIEGPQVADFMVLNRDDPNEKFWAARTRVINGAHLSTGDTLWSTPPKTRPMLTIITDTVDHQPLPNDAKSHDLLFCRCDSRHYELVAKKMGMPNCQDNLASAIADFKLTPEYVHDPFNLFMTTGLNDQGRPFYLPSDAKKGDYVEFYAEINCIIAISACPGGSSGSKSRPLGIEIFSYDDHRG